ncbi:unnamed protein product [Amaranthus hypochondriacus]
MELTMCNLKTQNYISPFLMTSSLCSTNSKHGLPKMMKGRIKCGKNTSLTVDLERQLHEIVNEGREWREMKNCCKDEIISSSSSSSAELIELLECLEREAIMGNDEGREAIDYNRRAQIFDKSSKVFQALKELAPSPA